MNRNDNAVPLPGRLLLIACVLLLVACSDRDPDEPRPLEDPSVYQNHNTPFRTHVAEIILQPDERTEIKAVMERDQAILYHWMTDGSLVYSDFHGHDPEDDSYWLRYREQEAGAGSSGSLVAPVSGEHGWYYRNDNPYEVVITLRVSGYYNAIEDYGIFDTPEQAVDQQE